MDSVQNILDDTQVRGAIDDYVNNSRPDADMALAALLETRLDLAQRSLENKGGEVNQLNQQLKDLGDLMGNVGKDLAKNAVQNPNPQHKITISDDTIIDMMKAGIHVADYRKALTGVQNASLPPLKRGDGSEIMLTSSSPLSDDFKNNTLNTRLYTKNGVQLGALDSQKISARWNEIEEGITNNALDSKGNPKYTVNDLKDLMEGKDGKDGWKALKDPKGKPYVFPLPNILQQSEADSLKLIKYCGGIKNGSIKVDPDFPVTQYDVTRASLEAFSDRLKLKQADYDKLSTKFNTDIQRIKSNIDTITELISALIKGNKDRILGIVSKM